LKFWFVQHLSRFQSLCFTSVTCLCLHLCKPTRFIVTCICLMAGVPTEMTFNTTSTVMMSQRDNTMRHDNALPVTCHSRCASHRTMHMSYRSKTYTWNDVILVKRSMIRVFFPHTCAICRPVENPYILS